MFYFAELLLYIIIYG